MKMPERRKGTKAPSLIILKNNKGTQPTGDVFRIIKPMVKSAVKMAVFAVNLSCYF